MKKLGYGGGATEIELAKQITSYGEICPGLEQYAIKKFAEAFEAIPRALAENSGVKANEVISKLYAVHQEGNKNVGLDIEVFEKNTMNLFYFVNAQPKNRHIKFKRKIRKCSDL